MENYVLMTVFLIAGHHVYCDAAGIRYMATLIRPIEASKAKEKHILKVFKYINTFEFEMLERLNLCLMSMSYLAL